MAFSLMASKWLFTRKYVIIHDSQACQAIKTNITAYCSLKEQREKHDNRFIDNIAQIDKIFTYPFNLNDKNNHAW